MWWRRRSIIRSFFLFLILIFIISTAIVSSYSSQSQSRTLSLLDSLKKKQRKSNSSESFVFEWQPCIALIYLFIFDVIIFNWEFGFDSIISFVVQKETKEQIESFVFKWQHCIALISLFFFSFDDIIFDWEFGSTSHPATPWASFFLFCSLFLSLFIFSISLFHFFIGRCRGREWDVIKKWKKNLKKKRRRNFSASRRWLELFPARIENKICKKKKPTNKKVVYPFPSNRAIVLENVVAPMKFGLHFLFCCWTTKNSIAAIKAAIFFYWKKKFNSQPDCFTEWPPFFQTKIATTPFFVSIKIFLLTKPKKKSSICRCGCQSFWGRSPRSHWIILLSFQTTWRWVEKKEHFNYFSMKNEEEYGTSSFVLSTRIRLVLNFPKWVVLPPGVIYPQVRETRGSPRIRSKSSSPMKKKRNGDHPGVIYPQDWEPYWSPRLRSAQQQKRNGDPRG